MIKVLLWDGRIVSIRGSEERHIQALRILMKVSGDDELTAEEADGGCLRIRACDIKEILDARGRPMFRKDDTLLTIRGESYGKGEKK